MCRNNSLTLPVLSMAAVDDIVHCVVPLMADICQLCRRKSVRVTASQRLCVFCWWSLPHGTLLPTYFGHALVITPSFAWDVATTGPFYSQSLTSISAWLSIHMSCNVWGEIAYPFPNLNGATVEVSEWISNVIPHFIMDVITFPMWD